MKTKLFKSDKNYILKKIQKESQTSLINFLVNTSIKTYDKKTNSIGLMDDISINIKKFNFTNNKDFIFFF